MSKFNKTVIGLVGPKTCGKSTVVNMLCEFYPIQESALADKLKNVICEVLNLKREQMDLQNLKEVPFENPVILDSQIVSKVLEKFEIEPVSSNISTCNSVLGKELRSPREAAQIIGTEVLRNIDTNIHCKSVRISDSAFTVVSDIRFHSEYLYFSNLRDVTFIPLYIQRDAAEQNVTPESHPSERDFLSFRDKCIKIDNNGNLAETEVQVKKSIDKVLYGGI